MSYAPERHDSPERVEQSVPRGTHAARYALIASALRDFFEQRGLCPYQRKLVAGLAAGFGDSHFRKEFSWAATTVGYYVNKVNQKLGTHSRSEILVEVISHVTKYPPVNANTARAIPRPTLEEGT